MEPHTREMIRLFMRNCGYTRLYGLFRTNGFRKILDDRQARAHFVRTVESYKPEWDSLVRIVTDMTLGSQGRDDRRDMPLWARINEQWNIQILPRLKATMLQDSTRPILYLNDDLASAVMGCDAPIQTLKAVQADNTSPYIFLNEDLTSAVMEYAAQLNTRSIQVDGIGYTLRLDGEERQ